MYVCIFQNNYRMGQKPCCTKSKFIITCVSKSKLKIESSASTQSFTSVAAVLNPLFVIATAKILCVDLKNETI